MKNVMSLFYFLLGSIFTSCVIAAVERVVNRMKSRSAGERVFIEMRGNGDEKLRIRRMRRGRVKGRKTGMEIEEIGENTER